MKALSLLQPWASLLAGGEKRVETRSWHTSHRGRIAIHASKAFRDEDRMLAIQTKAFYQSLSRLGFDNTSDLPLGSIVGVGSLVEMQPCVAIVKTLSDKELEFGNYSMGRWAWMFVDLCMFQKPIPCRGRQGLWNVPDNLLTLIEIERARS
jgi:hypothetical protein